MPSPMPSEREARPAPVRHRSTSSGLPRVALSWEQKAVLVLAVLIVLAAAMLAMTIWW